MVFDSEKKSDVAVLGLRVIFDEVRLREICQTWRITQLALFGSVLRDDFRPESDIDVLLTFDPAANWSLFDLMDLQENLQQILGRKVDLVEQKAIRNPYRRESIMATRKIIYEATQGDSTVVECLDQPNLKKVRSLKKRPAPKSKAG